MSAPIYFPLCDTAPFGDVVSHEHVFSFYLEPTPKRRKIDVSANEVDEDTVLENEAPGEGPDNDDPPLVPSNDAMGMVGDIFNRGSGHLDSRLSNIHV